MRPFTASAYVLVAVPSLAALALYAGVGGFRPAREDITSYYRQRSSRRVGAWAVVFVLALTLECVGLALGGHSKSRSHTQYHVGPPPGQSLGAMGVVRRLALARRPTNREAPPTGTR